MYPLIHFFATNVGSSSHPALEFFSVDKTCVTSVYDISVITILCSILLIYDIGLTSLVMSLASFWPIDTKNLLKPFAIAVLSVILVLPMQNSWFVLDLQLSLPIICFRIFQDFDISFLCISS